MSARSKRTATRKASPTGSTSSTGTSTGTSTGKTSAKKSTPSTGAGTARASRTATRAPSPSKPTAKKSTPSTGQAGARGGRTGTRPSSPTVNVASYPAISPPSVVTPKDTTVSSSDDTIIQTPPIETIPEVVYVEPPIEEVFLPPTYPEAGTISFEDITENSVIVYWKPKDDGGSPITGYHLVIKNEDTGYTILDVDQVEEGGMSVEILESGSNYRVYLIVINAVGNSPESSNDFKTLGVKLEQLYMRMVFEDATPIAGKIQSVNFILKKEAVGLLNNWWGKNHMINPDPNQNLVKVFQGQADDTLDLVTLQQAKDELLNMISQVDPKPLPPQLETESCIEYRTRVKNLGFSVDWLTPCPDVPIVPDRNSYDIKLVRASYMGTDKGKTVNIQTSINLTGVPVNSIHARIVIQQKLSGLPIYMNFQNLSVGGGTTFPLVFNIDDLGLNDLSEKTGIGGTGQATAKIHYKIFLWDSLENHMPLTPFPLLGDLIYDEEETKPDPDTGKEVTTSLLGKFLGVTALIGTLALLGSKRR